MVQAQKLAKKRRRDKVIASDSVITDYDYDTKGEWATVQLAFPAGFKRILFVSLMETLAKKIMLRETKGIKSCGVVKSAEVSLRCEPLECVDWLSSVGSLSMPRRRTLSKLKG